MLKVTPKFILVSTHKKTIVLRRITVKPVFSKHSKRRQKLVFKTGDHLMQVKLNYHHYLKPSF